MVTNNYFLMQLQAGDIYMFSSHNNDADMNKENMAMQL